MGACATAALWSALDRAHFVFNTPLYSPSKLTELAEKFYDSKIPQRLFPNKNGLNLQQIAKVLSKIGLDQEIMMDFSSRKSDNHLLAKQFIYSHIRYGFPMIMGIEFSDSDKELHALTLVGFVEPKDKILLHSMVTKTERNRLKPIFKSSYIDKFIVHDDQLGPFSELQFDEKFDSLKINWEQPKEQKVTLNSLLAIILPTWTFNLKLITNQVQILNDILFELNFNGYLFYWDLYITSSNTWKTELKQKNIVYNHNIIFNSLPQYVWILELFSISNDESDHKSNLEMSILFDITSTSSFAHTLIDFVIHENSFLDFRRNCYDKTAEMISNSTEVVNSKIENSNKIGDPMDIEKINIAMKSLYFLRRLFHHEEKGLFS